MRAPPLGWEDIAGLDEEPPVYTASERAAGARKRKRVVSVSAADAQPTVAAGPQKEQKAPLKRASPGSVDDTVPNLPNTPTEDTAGRVELGEQS